MFHLYLFEGIGRKFLPFSLFISFLSNYFITIYYLFFYGQLDFEKSSSCGLGDCILCLHQSNRVPGQDYMTMHI